jgi:hypothetical protein
MGLIAGIAAGLTLAGLIEYFDRTMRTEADVRAALNIPVLATIPMIRSKGRNRRQRSAAAAIVALGTVLTHWMMG